MDLSESAPSIVHPSVRAFPGIAARHRSFIGVHLLSGAVLAAAAGIYLSLTGLPDTFEAIVMVWLLSPILFAVLLRITANLPFVRSLWLTNLTVLITFLVLYTGGLSSFLIPWYLVIPAEAALSGDRRTVIGAAGFSLGALLLVVVLSGQEWLPISRISADMMPMLLAAGVMSAVIYGSAVALGVQRAHNLSERAARDGEARYRFLAENAMDVITRHDSEGRIIFASPACRLVLGLQPKDLEGQQFSALVHPADKDLLSDAFDRARYFGSDVSVEYRFRTGDEDYVWVETRCRPVVCFEATQLLPTPRGLPAPQCFEIICVTRDISERKNYETQLVEAREDAEAANHAKSRFLANMSHELRTPLNAVIGFSEMIRAQTFGPVGSPKYREYAELIHDSGRHLLNLINDVLDISKVEAGKFDLSRELLDIVAVVEDSLKFVAVTAKQAGITIETSLPRDLPKLYADGRAIRQILLNLLSNAIKFTPEQGAVGIDVQQVGDDLWILVCDTGVGIAEHDLERLGKPYQQADDEFIKSKTGTGLGLALARALTELHGGSMIIESELGEGTQVSVRLPLRVAIEQPQDNSAVVDEEIDTEQYGEPLSDLRGAA
ncbi:MAG: PAS domain S-box protein [Alphaproteobacteria bacterium]|nr:MAG: PAS domain S-box protein [Alphaproteobacteria bacterium]